MFFFEKVETKFVIGNYDKISDADWENMIFRKKQQIVGMTMKTFVVEADKDLRGADVFFMVLFLVDSYSIFLCLWQTM